MKYKYIIFDMDGTLFDTESISLKAWYAIAEKFHLPVNDAFLFSLIGTNRKSSKPLFDAQFPKNWPQEEVFEYHKQYVSEYKKIHGPLPKTDLSILFKTLKEKGYKIALCSSSNHEVITTNLSYVNLENEFEVIVDGTMVEKGKPFPDLYLKTLELLNAEAKDCLVIEDASTGITSAYEAGIDVVMVIDKIKPDEIIKNKTLHIFNHLDEILTIL